MKYEDVISQIGVNYDEVLRRFSGNEGLVKKFILKFPQDKSIDALEAAVAAKDYHGIEISAHTIKGVSGNLGFTQLYNDSAALTNAVRASDFAKADEMAPGVIALTRKINELINSIDQ